MSTSAPTPERTESRAGVCVPDPATAGCIAPYHDPNDINKGGPHGETNFEADLNGGAMNGFVAQAEKAQSCETPGTPQCRQPT